MSKIKTKKYYNNSIWSDIRGYLINKPNVKTLVQFKSSEERETYRERILQRLGISVNDYSVLNIHKIEIEAPAKYVFEQLLLWDGRSKYWPNKLACVKRVDTSLEKILIYFLGCEKISFGFLLRGIKINPLFNLKALKFQYSPASSDLSDARYLVYKCSGGYPIGIFVLFVSNSVPEKKEVEKSQLYSLVAFDFYGKKGWFYLNIINPIWEKIHNRVTANILNRTKIVFENEFNNETFEVKKEI